MTKYTYIPPNQPTTDDLILLTNNRANLKITTLYLKDRFGVPTVKHKATDTTESGHEWVFVDKDNIPFTVYANKGIGVVYALDATKDLEVQDFLFWVSNKK